MQAHADLAAVQKNARMYNTELQYTGTSILQGGLTQHREVPPECGGLALKLSIIRIIYCRLV